MKTYFCNPFFLPKIPSFKLIVILRHFQFTNSNIVHILLKIWMYESFLSFKLLIVFQNVKSEKKTLMKEATMKCGLCKTSVIHIYWLNGKRGHFSFCHFWFILFIDIIPPPLLFSFILFNGITMLYFYIHCRKESNFK